MFAHVLNLFFPKTCAGCNALLLQTETVICTQCRHDIPLTNHFQVKENEAFAKFYGKVPVEFVVALMEFHKKGIVQEMIHKLKYKNQQDIGKVIGYWCAENLKALPEINQIDCIVPVPLHPKKLRKRGYNQVSTFGKTLAEVLEIPYDENILVRTQFTETQTKKTLLNRSENVKDIFDINHTYSTPFRNFLLIDDVITTGATLVSCAKALQKIPNSTVSIACMAMTM